VRDERILQARFDRRARIDGDTVNPGLQRNYFLELSRVPHACGRSFLVLFGAPVDD